MGHISGSSGVGSGTHTCLVGVQAALDAVHQAASGEAAEDGLEVKSIDEDTLDHSGDGGDVHKNDDQGNQDVDDAHNGNQHAGDLGQALGAAHNANGKQDSQDSTDDPGRGSLVVEAEACKSGLQVVGSQRIVAHGIGQNDNHGENHAQPALMQRSFHVIGGAAVAGAVLIALFIDLSQRRLDKSRSTANQSDQPHPEHTAHTAQTDGSGHTDDVAGTHAGGSGHHQGAEGGNGIFTLGLFTHHTDGFAKQTELHSLGANGEIQAAANQEYDNKRNGQLLRAAVEEIADRVNNAIHFLNHDFFSLFLSDSSRIGIRRYFNYTAFREKSNTRLFTGYLGLFPTCTCKLQNMCYTVVCHTNMKNMITLRGEHMAGGKHILGKPKGHHIFGTAKVGDRGQIVIPKEARCFYDIQPGDTLLILGDSESGLIVTKPEVLEQVAQQILGNAKKESTEL